MKTKYNGLNYYFVLYQYTVLFIFKLSRVVKTSRRATRINI